MSQKTADIANALGVQPRLMSSDPPAMARARAKLTFPGGLSLAMLVVILVGFAPTFFLRAFFDVPEIPGYLILHGAVSTTWFVLAFVQTQLAAHRNLRLHRRLGIGGVIVAFAAVASGVQTSLGMVPRRLAAGMHLDAAELEFLGLISSANIAFFIMFPVLIALAIGFRRRPAIHHRLMLVASISMIGPAAMRIASWFGEVPNPITPIIVFGFLAALIGHDIRAEGRSHAATIAGAAFAILVGVSVQLIKFGDKIIAWQLAQFGS